MRLPLDEIARLAGVKFTPVAGWRSRGHEYPATPQAVVRHADASFRTSGPLGGLDSVVNGSQTAPPPVGNFHIGRDGHVYLVAAGVSNNAGHGNARAIGHRDWQGNEYTVGIEAANDNGREKPPEPWPAVQIEAYNRLVLGIQKWLAARHGRPVAQQVQYDLGHKDWSTRGKTDPTYNTAQARTRVAVMAAERPPDRLFLGSTGRKVRELYGHAAVIPYPDSPVPGATAAQHFGMRDNGYFGPAYREFVKWWARQHPAALGTDESFTRGITTPGFWYNLRHR
jgi:hypothetical protein